MQFKVNNELYDVVIIRKRTTKNTYIRVKDDLKIYVTTNTFTLNMFIKNLHNGHKKEGINLCNYSFSQASKTYFSKACHSSISPHFME